MNLNVGGTAHVALWDAINALVDASGGRNGVSTARMTAVANVESALRAALADSEGTRAVECLRRARNAEATLADALFVLGMVDKNNRIDAGETGKAWSGRFVADEVRRVLAGESGDDQAAGEGRVASVTAPNATSAPADRSAGTGA